MKRTVWVEAWIKRSVNEMQDSLFNFSLVFFAN